MSNTNPLSPRLPDRRGAAFATLLAGGLVVGTMDLLFAWGFWLHKGATLTGTLQSIAEGWFGESSHQMGITSAVVGALSHYSIAVVFVTTYWLCALRFPTLTRHPVGNGVIYGLLIYMAMHFVVLPLSAAEPPGFSNHAWVASSIAAHAVFGTLCALFARRATNGA